jgi:hypothetical protein
VGANARLSGQIGDKVSISLTLARPKQHDLQAFLDGPGRTRTCARRIMSCKIRGSLGAFWHLTAQSGNRDKAQRTEEGGEEAPDTAHRRDRRQPVDAVTCIRVSRGWLQGERPSRRRRCARAAAVRSVREDAGPDQRRRGGLQGHLLRTVGPPHKAAVAHGRR